MKNPNSLEVFKRASVMVEAVYRLTAIFPSDEKYNLTSQIRRAAVSVPSNLVEGCSRESEREFARFAEIALGSSMELEYQLGLAKRLVQEAILEFHFESSRFDEPISLASEVTRMLIGLGKTLRSEL